MDKTLVKEIIREFEEISRIINARLPQLYSMLGETYSIQSNKMIGIEKQKNDMMQKIEEMRQQAMAQVQESIGNINPISPSNRLTFPEMTKPSAGVSAKEIEQIKKQMLAKIEEKKNSVLKENKPDDDNKW